MIPNMQEILRLLTMSLFMVGATSEMSEEDAREQMRLVMNRYYVDEPEKVDLALELLDAMTCEDFGVVLANYMDYANLLSVLSSITQHLN